MLNVVTSGVIFVTPCSHFTNIKQVIELWLFLKKGKSFKRFNVTDVWKRRWRMNWEGGRRVEQEKIIRCTWFQLKPSFSIWCNNDSPPPTSLSGPALLNNMPRGVCLSVCVWAACYLSHLTPHSLQVWHSWRAKLEGNHAYGFLNLETDEKLN